MSNFEIVGLMSGTSLDGLDILHANFQKKGGKWSFEILHSSSAPYPDVLKLKLQNATEFGKEEIEALDIEFGHEMARRVNQFILEKKIDKEKIDAVASHGHTIFHQPQNGFSLQIGCGTTLAKETGMNVINDFRNKDIQAGGQGAPLVPIGDKLLFADKADAFLNLGGFCNITFQNEMNKWVAFDISPCNLPLNRLAGLKDKAYDDGGEMAQTGQLNFFLLDLLNNLPYYKKEYPKSLGTEWLEESFYPMIKFSKNVEDNLCTIVEHVAIQIADVLNHNKISKTLVTGGGAYNSFLLKRIQHHSDSELIVPSAEIIEFKEALIFGFLGALFLADEPSNVPSATGAKESVRLGVLHAVD
jgi:anhydro-N-acetylmuramic acid kinase